MISKIKNKCDSKERWRDSVLSNMNNNTHTTDISIYTETDYKNDQSKFDKSIKEGKLDLSTFQRLMINDICRHTNIIENGCIGDINMRDIETAMKYPKQGWKTLLAVS